MIDTKASIDADTSTSGNKAELDAVVGDADATTESPEEAGVQDRRDEIAGGMTKSRRQLSVSLRGFVGGLVVVLFAATAGVFGWLYFGAKGQLSTQELAAANRIHAEEVASNYAVHAAEMDYQDFNGWKLKLVNGTSPELKDKLTKAADSMQQVLAPLQWKSSARPLAAKVRSDNNGIYVVDSFVSVLTKTMQAPDGLQSTATYSVTLDSKNNWQITDVGGIDAALGK